MGETLFKKVDYTLSKLIDQIEMGTLGLPDIQRQFKWADAKARDLFDSMYRGYPVGFFLFWENGFEPHERQIGIDNKQKTPSLLIVDGQQRLTSLYAVIKGVPVIRDGYKKKHIQIGFNPLKRNFEVMDASTVKNPEYIPNISVLWAKDADVFDLVDEYIEKLEKSREAAGKELKGPEKKKIKKAINDLSKLMGFPFAALELASSIEEENVAEVFVRINSKGTVLNQADFILTLMSVFWEDGRKEIEEFCKNAHVPARGGASPFNYFITPEPEHLLRASVGLGFNRARLKYAYALLRGKDLETGEFSEQRRDEQFKMLQEAHKKALDLQNWHDFLKCLQMAGYRGANMISSKVTVIYNYILYLIGKEKFNIEKHKLSKIISQWFFVSSLTRRYTSSPESRLARDLTDIKELKSSEEYIGWFNDNIDAELTEDFWGITLSNRLSTSSATTPLIHAYHASLNLLNAKVLFSNKKVFDLLDPAIKAKKSAVERHHLFPKEYLKSLGITSKRDQNQVANQALVEWDDNIKISDKSPSKYVKKYLSRFNEREIKKMYFWHGLVEGWEKMKYPEFLTERRKQMAKVIKEGFSKLRS